MLTPTLVDQFQLLLLGANPWLEDGWPADGLRDELERLSCFIDPGDQFVFVLNSSGTTLYPSPETEICNYCNNEQGVTPQEWASYIFANTLDFHERFIASPINPEKQVRFFKIQTGTQGWPLPGQIKECDRQTAFAALRFRVWDTLLELYAEGSELVDEMLDLYISPELTDIDDIYQAMINAFT